MDTEMCLRKENVRFQKQARIKLKTFVPIVFIRLYQNSITG